MIAIACQESGGNHRSTKDAGGGVGLMQIQASAVKKVTAYNYETGKIDVLNVSEAKLGDVDFNIRVATMIFQTKIKQMNKNTCLALQSYNMGEGTMAKVLRVYSQVSGRSVEEIKNDPTDLGWIGYLKGYPGDPNYVSNTTRYYSGTPESLNIENNVQEVQAKTR